MSVMSYKLQYRLVLQRDDFHQGRDFHHGTGTKSDKRVEGHVQVARRANANACPVIAVMQLGFIVGV